MRRTEVLYDYAEKVMFRQIFNLHMNFFSVFAVQSSLKQVY